MTVVLTLPTSPVASYKDPACSFQVTQKFIHRKMRPNLPQELVDKIIDLVAFNERNTNMRDLRSCSLTARSWSHRSQQYIFESLTISSFGCFRRWASEIDPASGILSYVRTLTLCDNLTWQFSPDILTQFEPHLDAFHRLERLNLEGFHLHSDIRHADLFPKWFGRFRNTLKTLNLESCSLSPNVFQSIIHLFPLDNISISDDCHAVTATENDRALERDLGSVTHFRGCLETGINTLREFLPCLLTVPVQFHRLVCVFNEEGHQIVSACAPTLQTLFFEAYRGANDVQVNPIFLPALRTFEFWIGDWGDVEPMICHYFPLIESAPNLSTIHIAVNEETKDSDILSLSDSSGWKEVDLHLCRLAQGARGPVMLVLDVVLSLDLPNGKDPFGILAGSQFLSGFLEEGGLIRFE